MFNVVTLYGRETRLVYETERTALGALERCSGAEDACGKIKRNSNRQVLGTIGEKRSLTDSNRKWRAHTSKDVQKCRVV